MANLFPIDENAKRLSEQSFLLSEFLAKMAPDYAPPQLRRRAVVHAHCHHKAIMSMEDEVELLSKLGLDFEILDSGCCGMAGSFGFEKGARYDVSLQSGERVLLPAVRGATKDTLIVADGFSCREQIAQTTDRRALHLAEVLDMALHAQQEKVVEQYPETAYEQPKAPHPSGVAVAAGIAATVGLAFGAFWLTRDHRTRGRSTLPSRGR